MMEVQVWGDILLNIARLRVKVGILLNVTRLTVMEGDGG